MRVCVLSSSPKSQAVGLPPSPGTRFTSPAFPGAAVAPLGWDAGGHADALSDSVLQEGVKRKKPKASGCLAGLFTISYPSVVWEIPS